MPTARDDTRRAILDTAQRIMAHKGYAAVGINEILIEAGVPKGSFYHYFGSKDAFGEAMMKAYFTDYLADMDRIFAEAGLTSAQRLMKYWERWYGMQRFDDCQGKCLTVKLGAEVSDLSKSMRLALAEGTTEIIDRLERIIGSGAEDGSLTIAGNARTVATSLCHMWIGASIMAKIHRQPASLDTAMATTRQMLNICLSPAP